jgi:thioredoxin-like negative regulator of GroEL
MIYLTPYNFEEEILEFDGFCMVKFSNKGCHLCRQLENVYERLFRRYGSKIKFATVDVLVNPDLGRVFEIDGVPTIYFFAEGSAAEIPYPGDSSNFSGYEEEYLIEFLEGHLDQGKR